MSNYLQILRFEISISFLFFLFKEKQKKFFLLNLAGFLRGNIWFSYLLFFTSSLKSFLIINCSNPLPKSAEKAETKAQPTIWSIPKRPPRSPSISQNVQTLLLCNVFVSLTSNQISRNVLLSSFSYYTLVIDVSYQTQFCYRKPSPRLARFVSSCSSCFTKVYMTF